MNPSQPFILRPVATTLLMIAIMLSGMLAFKFLPVAALPEVDYPTIQVQTFYPGASPDVMTSSVTAPLEVQFGQMPNLNQMSSVSSAGSSVITLQFGLTISLDVAEQEVQAAINAAGNLLPSDLPAPPIYAKVNPADAPILTLGLTSKTMPLTQVQDFVNTRLAQKISQLPGVGLVSLSGGQRPAVRIQADIRKLAAYGLNIDDLRTTLGNANINTPKGNFDGPMRAYTINANDQIREAKDYRSLIIAYKNGSPVRLSDVGDVVNGAQESRFVGGSQRVPLLLARKLGDRVALGAAVTRIEHLSGRALVHTTRGRVAARRVVVAAPPKQVLGIDFSPGMPAGRRTLLTKMQMGRLMKCDAVYATPFWRAAGMSGSGVAATGVTRAVFDNSPANGHVGVLLAFVGGGAWREIGRLPKAQRRRKVLEGFAQMFGDQALHPIEYTEHDWTLEPWTTGAPTALPRLGAITKHGSAIRRPFRRVHWAGTETSTYWAGNMDGAVRSGERAAREVLTHL